MKIEIGVALTLPYSMVILVFDLYSKQVLNFHYFENKIRVEFAMICSAMSAFIDVAQW